jgi:hypothetical protein
MPKPKTKQRKLNLVFDSIFNVQSKEHLDHELDKILHNIDPEVAILFRRYVAIVNRESLKSNGKIKPFTADTVSVNLKNLLVGSPTIPEQIKTLNRVIARYCGRQ